MGNSIHVSIHIQVTLSVAGLLEKENKKKKRKGSYRPAYRDWSHNDCTTNECLHHWEKWLSRWLVCAGKFTSMHVWKEFHYTCIHHGVIVIQAIWNTGIYKTQKRHDGDPGAPCVHWTCINTDHIKHRPGARTAWVVTGRYTTYNTHPVSHFACHHSPSTHSTDFIVTDRNDKRNFCANKNIYSRINWRFFVV